MEARGWLLAEVRGFDFVGLHLVGSHGVLPGVSDFPAGLRVAG
jgi:hypothetical protein